MTEQIVTEAQVKAFVRHMGYAAHAATGYRESIFVPDLEHDIRAAPEHFISTKETSDGW